MGGGGETGSGELRAIGSVENENGVESGVDGLGEAEEVKRLVFGEGEQVVVNGGVVGVSIDDGVEREGFGGFGREVGAVIFFGKLTDDESAGSGESEAGLGGDLVNTCRDIGRGGDAVAKGVWPFR